MAKKCDVCGRGAQTGHRRSHSNIATKVKRQLNLQKKKIGNVTKSVCVSCLKSTLKSQAV